MTTRALDLPIELWQHAISNLDKDASLRDLQALSLTSEGLRAIAQPRLFKTLRLSALPFSGAAGRVEGIVQLFSSRPESRSWTSTLTVYGTDYESSRLGEESDGSTPETPIIRSLFQEMKSLQKVQLSYFRLTLPMFRHLYDLPLLRGLTLGGTSIVELNEDEISRWSSLGLRNLRIERDAEPSNLSVDMQVYGALLCPSLQTLEVGPTVAQELFRRLANALDHQLPSLRQFNIILSTDVFHEHARSLFSFLQSCPNLRGLDLPARSMPLHGAKLEVGGRPISPDDIKDCVPVLESIHATAELVRILLPGRPISDIDAVFPIDSPLVLSESALKSFGFTPLPLTALSLGAAIVAGDSLELLGRLFPGLKELRLRVIGNDLSEWYNDDLGLKIASFKHLDKLTIYPLEPHFELAKGQETADRERKFLSQAQEHGSRLTFMSLGQHDEWTKGDKGIWESQFEKARATLGQWFN